MVSQELNTQNVNTMSMGERLVSAGLLSDRDLERARLAKREMGCMLGQALVRPVSYTHLTLPTSVMG